MNIGQRDQSSEGTDVGETMSDEQLRMSSEVRTQSASSRLERSHWFAVTLMVADQVRLAGCCAKSD
jgi:hypothetical protein